MTKGNREKGKGQQVRVRDKGEKVKGNWGQGSGENRKRPEYKGMI